MSIVFNMTEGAAVKLVSISITNPPTKTTYTAGESFDPAGMVVTAVYSNGVTATATGVSYSPSGALTDGTTSVTVQYTEGGVTVTAKQAITVIHRLDSISVTTNPSKMSYEYGDTFNTSGMVVTANYSDGTSAAVSGYTYSPTALNTIGTQTVTVTYTERGITKTTSVSITVERKTISATPTQSGSLTYSGSAQSPSWSGYDAAKMTLGGVTSGTNAGSYNATFTPTANYRWSDGTTTAKTVAWSITKAAGSLSISPTSLSLTASSKTGTITVTRAGDGVITATSSSTSVATVSVSGTKVTVTGKASGSATITIKVAAGTNHNAPSNKTCSVSVKLMDSTFGNNDWATIINACQTNSVPSSWVVGNSKTMTINGKDYQIDIIGKNHDTYASGGTAPLTFQMHDCYETTYRMNETLTNVGGWKSSTLRNTDLPALLALMPSEVQGGIREVNKLCFAGGTSTNVITVADKLFLLSISELYIGSNYEGSVYDYYSAGNSKVKNVNGSAYTWRTRTPYAGDTTSFKVINASGSDAYGGARGSFGVPFAFCF